MHQNLHRKPIRGRNFRFNSVNSNDTKNSFRTQDNYSSDRWKVLSNTTLYNIARFLMGNEVQIVTKNDRIEGVLRSFDSSTVWLSKVIVYDFTINENIPLIKEIHDGKEVSWRDIFMIKVLSNNGKTESVLIDHEISQRKQINKIVQPDDKNFVPYFDEDESQIQEEKDEDNIDITMKGDQCCWYNPEDMIKVNEERFNIKSTFNDNMEEYTTKIDRSDPLLREKYERAEKLAWEMENDASLNRVKQLEDGDEERDEESLFSAVVSADPCPTMTPEMPANATIAVSVKLNPNAPEFHPRTKHDCTLESLEEMPAATMSMMSENIQQHQIMQRIMQMSMSPQAQSVVAQVSQQQYPMVNQQRLVSAGPGQWTAMPVHQQQHQGHHNQAPPGQYMIQQYIPHQGQLVPSVFQARQMTGAGSVQPLETGQSTAGLLFYSPASLGGQFFVQPSSDHLSSSLGGTVVAGGGDMGPSAVYGTVMDAAALQQLRQPHLVPANIPVLQTAPGGGGGSGHVTIHQQAPPQLPSNHHIAGYYTQSSHPLLAAHQAMATGHPNFPQILFNQQAQLQAGPNLQNYIPNGRP